MGISDVFGGVKGERYRKERAYTVGASPSFFDLNLRVMIYLLVI